MAAERLVIPFLLPGRAKAYAYCIRKSNRFARIQGANANGSNEKSGVYSAISLREK
jgi:hypothetical protein